GPGVRAAPGARRVRRQYPDEPAGAAEGAVGGRFQLRASDRGRRRARPHRPGCETDRLGSGRRLPVTGHPARPAAHLLTTHTAEERGKMSAPDTAALQTATAINLRIAEELQAAPGQVRAAVELLDGGATVPFVARYRKEVTGGLDDTQLRTLEERLRYLRELEERRAAVLESIESQGKLDDALRAQILAADAKARLEDIYLPF